MLLRVRCALRQRSQCLAPRWKLFGCAFKKTKRHCTWINMVYSISVFFSIKIPQYWRVCPPKLHIFNDGHTLLLSKKCYPFANGNFYGESLVVEIKTISNIHTYIGYASYVCNFMDCLWCSFITLQISRLLSVFDG